MPGADAPRTGALSRSAITGLAVARVGMAGSSMMQQE